MSRRTGIPATKSATLHTTSQASDRLTDTQWTNWRPAARSRALLWLANGALLLWLVFLIGLLALG